jgi:hypothetical protein
MPGSLFLPLLAFALFARSSCVKSARDYSPLAAPPVRNPVYNLYEAYGEANATWQPPIWNRDGTICETRRARLPGRSSSLRVRPLGHRGRRRQPYAPPGTF